MSKFMLLYQSNNSASEKMAKASPEQMQASMGEWMQWREKAGGEAKVEFGMPLQVGKHVEGRGDVADGETSVNGYSIIQADSLDAATELVKDHPHLKTEGNSIEVLEFLPMPGM